MALFNSKAKAKVLNEEPKLDENGNPIIENETEETNSENENQEENNSTEEKEEQVENNVQHEVENNITTSEEPKPETPASNGNVVVMSRRGYKITLEELTGKKNSEGDAEYVRKSYEIKANLDEKGNVLSGKSGAVVNSFDRKTWSHIAKTETIKRAIKNRIIIVR